MTGKSDKIGKFGVDWLSVGIFFVLMVLGWLNIYAAVFDESAVAGFSFGPRYGSQPMWMGVCAVVAVVIMLIDEIYYHIIAYPLYYFMLVVLFATLFIGTNVNGAQSWIRLGSLSIQPAEFAKCATALALARYMSSYTFSMSNWKSKVVAALIFIAPMIIIVM